jgi:hypothetical protein
LEKSTFETPALFGDHHVTEVRSLLLSIPGVQEVYASSAFFMVEVTYDENSITETLLKDRLDEWGYLREIHTFIEPDRHMGLGHENGYHRTAAMYETLKHTVSFQQHVLANGRVQWYCPGIGLVERSEN